jgi:hypothetical protein
MTEERNTEQDERTYCEGCKTEFAFVSQGYLRRNLCIYCEASSEPLDLSEYDN